MQLCDLLLPESTYVEEKMVDSKKRTLEMLSQLLAAHNTPLAAPQIFEQLLARERLGSTALGHGIAIPHARVDGINKPIGALLKLQQGIDFDAPDNQDADILCALLVPTEATDEHLKTLAHLAKLFSEPKVHQVLKQCTDARSLYQDALRCAKDYG